MKPFFCYYGGKWRAAPRYPAPVHEAIIEPFAGAAGYSVRHNARKVTLVEKDPVVAALWRYLIEVPAEEILRLPLVVEDVRHLHICQEAKSLIGFWLNKGMMAPCNIPSKWMRDHAIEGTRLNTYWGAGVRARIASQVEQIRHWRVVEGDFWRVPYEEATWFVDPPYQIAGAKYKHGSAAVDFSLLADFCYTRKGQVIVCENAGAQWMPFEHFGNFKSLEGKHGKATSAEVIYHRNPSRFARGLF